MLVEQGGDARSSASQPNPFRRNNVTVKTAEGNSKRSRENSALATKDASAREGENASWSNATYRARGRPYSAPRSVSSTQSFQSSYDDDWNDNTVMNQPSPQSPVLDWLEAAAVKGEQACEQARMALTTSSEKVGETAKVMAVGDNGQAGAAMAAAGPPVSKKESSIDSVAKEDVRINQSAAADVVLSNSHAADEIESELMEVDTCALTADFQTAAVQSANATAEANHNELMGQNVQKLAAAANTVDIAQTAPTESMSLEEEDALLMTSEELVSEVNRLGETAHAALGNLTIMIPDPSLSSDVPPDALLQADSPSESCL